MNHRPLAIKGNQPAKGEFLPVLPPTPVQRVNAVLGEPPVPALGKPMDGLPIAAGLDERGNSPLVTRREASR
jgi:hypothetical protein